MEQAVAPCPEITMIIKGQKVRALLDMGSQVTLTNESYFLQNIQQLLPTVDKDHLNAQKLFYLKRGGGWMRTTYQILFSRHPSQWQTH